MDRSFLKHAATYGLATALTYLGGFILLPLYLRCLGPGDFGVLEVLGRLAETFAALLLFGGLHQALMTFYQQASDEAARRRVVGASLLLVLTVCVIGGGGAVVVGPWLAGRLAPSVALSPTVVRLAIVGIMLEALAFMGRGLIQARVESRTYVVVVIVQLLLRVALGVVLVRVLGWGVTGALAANAVTAALFGLGLIGRECLRGVAWPEMGQVRAMLSFALPMLPGGLCYFILNHGDRFFLLRDHGDAAVGQYALGYKLAMLVGLFSLNPLYMVWSSRMYAAAKRDDAAEVFGAVFLRTTAAFLFVGLGMCLFAPEAVTLLGGEQFLPAAAVIPIVVLACFCQSAATLMDAVLYVKRRTALKLGVTLATTAVMLALYWLLIPAHGNLGAAVATLGGFLFLAVATFAVSRRVFRVRYPWARLAGLLALAVGLWLVGVGLPAALSLVGIVLPAAWFVAAKAVLWLAAPLIAWFTGLVSADERAVVRDLVTRFLGGERSGALLADR